MKKIILYSTPTCVWCKMAKEFFKNRGIAYEERDVLHDLKMREEMYKKSHQYGVPVFDIDGEIHVGFNRPEIEKALGLVSH